MSTVRIREELTSTKNDPIMKKIFWEDPYQNILNTNVVSVSGNEVLLAETIAYHFSGGQASDRSSINGMEVSSSRFSDDKKLIYYTLPDGHGLKEGDSVSMEIDWPTRYRLMRLHFACEMLLEIVTTLYHLEKTGANIEPDKARVDFQYDGNINSLLASILVEFNRVVHANLPIIKDYSDRENHHRFWRVENFWGKQKPAEIPCGGTHCHTTGEIGSVHLARKRGGNIKLDDTGNTAHVERIVITLDDDTAIEAKHPPVFFKMR